MLSFNPRTPCGVRLIIVKTMIRFITFQSTHSLRSATYFVQGFALKQLVSIHALLAECDPGFFIDDDCPDGFNPRTPCGVRLAIIHREQPGTMSFNPRTPCGVRPRREGTWCAPTMFQSTHSLRSATRCGRRTFSGLLCFNPRTPCGVRRVLTPVAVFDTVFQSTHSLRSATGAVDVHSPDYYVSIHALLAECDGY